ncbi:MAG: hypothetical protein H6821_03775 [Planctomycetaceae bacterium]|nr:hypothetical protein [Planctomycetales bacterium]MCA9145134.1 hypothetical protein [Planctomycetales bacterium]MCB9873276.1 hypothetical protein [Planctomycetaceae bacterium]MCB9939425.1 hypothetical protein [Planctomycetaceae bacterium]
MYYTYLLGVILAAAMLVQPRILEANPHSSEIDAPLAAHGDKVAQALHAKIASLSESGTHEARIQLESVAAGKGASLGGKAIGSARVKLIQVDRLASQLEIYGEPSGVDFNFRFREIQDDHWRNVIKGFAAAPGSQRYVASIRLAVQKQSPSRMKLLEKIQKLAVEQKWQAAEDELYGLFDALEAGTCFLSDQERMEISRPFSEVKSAIDTAMHRLRSQEAAQLLGQSRVEQTPDFASHMKAFQEATAAVATSSQANWDGEQLTGPQLVEKISDRWTEVHVACIRCRALDWAMQPLFQMAGANATKISPDPTSQTLQSQYAQFSTAAIEAIIALIRADASRVVGNDVAKLYTEYLGVIAPLAHQVADDNAVKAWEVALQQLAARAPAFEAEVKSYETATQELLRWRARVASSLAQSRSSEFLTLDKHLYDATVSKTPFLGLFPERPDQQLAPRLLASAPAILTVATPRLMGKQATAFDVVRVTPTSSSSIARYRARTYANVPAGLDLSRQVSALKSDLMTSEQASALTLAAATSLYSAERGDLASVGGEIVGHHLEAIITRFADLPQPAAILVPLGVLPTEDIKQPLLPQMVMRFDLNPRWAQHEHFFRDLDRDPTE